MYFSFIVVRLYHIVDLNLNWEDIGNSELVFEKKKSVISSDYMQLYRQGIITQVALPW